MKLVPRTLLGRTSLYLGLLMLFSQALWFFSARYFLLRPLKASNERQVGDVIALVQTLIETRPNEALSPPSADALFSTLDVLRVVPDSETRPEFDPNPGLNFPSDWGDMLRKKFGPAVLVQKQQGEPIVWIRFPAGGKLFWLARPLGHPAILPYSVLIWVGLGLVLSHVAAYLIIFRLTQNLRQVTEAARAVGRGELPRALEESGPQEIRDLSAGFNQMAADLKKLDADRRLMLAGISHDLRTPLTHLRIAVELAGTHAEPEIAAGMVHDLEDMDSILKQFLDYARDGSEEPPEEGDLNAIVGEICQRYTARGHLVEMALGAVPPFTFRKLAMRRVIANLVDNAVRYGRKGVQVKTQFHGTTASVVVSDDGPGIRSGAPADFIKPFAREDISRSEPGAGLGLAIVDRVMRLHGGSLRLENREAGGLLATIELPIASASPKNAETVKVAP